ncbi:YgiW/YdeI family stress tolerance OB fold protein [Cedecea davisae]|uniref:YgiW/YdeI family stress tolerance OB fold protein n=1 Tax=Cedecea davisae TaxID=158484 RepID=A0ABS6DKK9_9ENTR|nr:NirD/YgiW/YdeI family stress tolerance protein [Cedecea davisae]MBU4683764.1 YgiW/YdeI family stress tolerance OB fold protein [Cedecea davisae]MBU4687051.1 YgiW/YdeI family stress tolerance OB fold protein [Cedecea davisae]
MKKTAAMFAIVALTSAPVFAAQTGGGFVDPNAQVQTQPGQQGGFVGPTGNKTTVKQAKTFSDDTWVTLTGKIEQRIGGEHYIFRDATDSVNVDIDHKRWNGLTVTPQDTVEIQGEVDKDWNSVEIDVKQISKVK